MSVNAKGEVSERTGRLRWALRMKRRPRTLAGHARLLWHDFITHGLFGSGTERCQDCGRSYPLWHADDGLWERVFGHTGGLSCPGCFDLRATEAGLSIEFRAIRFARSSFHEIEHT